MHHEIQTKNRQKYYYLAENIRIAGNKWKRVRIYLGKNLSKKELQKLMKTKNKGLEAKVREIKQLHDPLLSLLTKKQLQKLEKVKKEYNKTMKTIDKALWQKYYESFITEFTYDSNAIEGSSLTKQETGLILFENITPEGKPLREIREAENHKQAFDYMTKYKEGMTKRFILGLHKKLMHNILWKYAGVFRDVQVVIRGAEFTPPPADKVKEEFKDLMKWYGANKRKYHPVIIAAFFHSVFEAVHPFRDGNGRTGRLLLNFILKENKYPMIDIKNTDKLKYYKALEEAQLNSNLKPLVNLIQKCMETSRIWI